jgi:L-asparagine transporter-like permease
MKTLKVILCGIGGFAAALLILTGGGALIRGTPFADGFKSFWNWAIAAMSGFSCGYTYWYNHTKK